MIRLELIAGLLGFALWLYCLIDVIRSGDDEVRNLSKVIWLIVVLLFPVVGSIAWIVAGRPVGARPVPRYERSVPQFPEYDRPGRAAATDPAADEAFLQRVRERAEAQRRAYREQQLRRERQERGEADPPS